MFAEHCVFVYIVCIYQLLQPYVNYWNIESRLHLEERKMHSHPFRALRRLVLATCAGHLPPPVLLLCFLCTVRCLFCILNFQRFSLCAKSNYTTMCTWSAIFHQNRCSFFYTNFVKQTLYSKRCTRSVFFARLFLHRRFVRAHCNILRME